MVMLDRRRFLATLGGGVGAAALGPSPALFRRLRRRLDAIGLQLYTVRADMRRDLPGTLALVAAIGYREVEFAGYFGQTPADLRRLLDRHGLRAPGTHVAKEALLADAPAVLDAAAAMGCRYVIVAWIPAEERRSLDGWRRVADDFNAIGARCRDAGLQFAYHNHDYEFGEVEGAVPYDVLLGATEPELVQLEIDLFWMTKGGRDPLAYFAHHSDRIPLVHVKDSAGPPEHRMVDVGSGTIDWRRLLAAAHRAGVRHYFVEHDSPADPLASSRAGYTYLKDLEI